MQKTINKGIVFFDLDGTLLDNVRGIVPESALCGIGMLRENGYVVCLATGRNMDAHNSKNYRDIIAPDCIIHNNGVRITAGEELIFEHFMDRGLLRRIVDFCLERNICIGTSIGAHDYFTLPAVKTAADIVYNRYIRRNYERIEKLFEDEIPVPAVSLAAEDVGCIRDEFEDAFPDLALFVFNSNTGADIVEKGFSKADGMERVCVHYGIPMEKTYAFGDSANDVPMLLKANVGIAMGQADTVTKEAADLVTDAVGSDGIINALIRLGLIS